MPRTGLRFLPLLVILLGTAFTQHGRLNWSTPIGPAGDRVALVLESRNAPAELAIADSRTGRQLFSRRLRPSPDAHLTTVDLVTSPATKLTYSAVEGESGVIVSIDPQTGESSNFFTLPNSDRVGQLALGPDGTTLYVGGEADDYVLDAASGALEATAPGIGGFPLGYHLLALAPAQGRLYALSGSGYTVLDSKTFQVQRHVDIRDTPLAAALSSDEKSLYLGVFSGYLDVVDIGSRRIARRIALGAVPSDLVLDDATQTLYVAAGEGLSVIDARTSTVIGTVSGIGIPFNLAFDAPAHACFAATDTGLWRIDARTLEIKQLYRASTKTVQGIAAT